jgi:hypothetical protein
MHYEQAQHARQRESQNATLWVDGSCDRENNRRQNDRPNIYENGNAEQERGDRDRPLRPVGAQSVHGRSRDTFCAPCGFHDRAEHRAQSDKKGEAPQGRPGAVPKDREDLTYRYPASQPEARTHDKEREKRVYPESNDEE